jgi:glycine/D-amino acid oxidase-like deaminating enzyme
MANLKYLHTDGLGKVCYGCTEEALASEPWCVRIFGELEREMLANEQINPVTGQIETIPPTDEELARQSDLATSVPRLQDIYILTPENYRASLADLGPDMAFARLADDVHKLTMALSLVLGEIRQR